jgi:hypothetical protein
VVLEEDIPTPYNGWCQLILEIGAAACTNLRPPNTSHLIDVEYVMRFGTTPCDALQKAPKRLPEPQVGSSNLPRVTIK